MDVTVYDHRQLWEGPGAREPRITQEELRVGDLLRMDDGSLRPAFSKWAFGPKNAGEGRVYGPFRELSERQQAILDAPFSHRFLIDVRSDGAMVLRENFGHYAPGLYVVDRAGRATRVDRPYGNGDPWG